MRLLVQHNSRYRYPKPAYLGDHTLRLRPSTHTRARIESYGLTIGQPSSEIRWQQDPYGNHVAQVHFDPETPTEALEISVEIAVEVQPVNPFDFYLDEAVRDVPFAYDSVLTHDLAPFLARDDSAYATGPFYEKFSSALPRTGSTTDMLVAMNQAVNQGLRYVIREESGIWTPEETLRQGRGSCRDFAVLLVALFRERKLAARFASGYLIQLTDEGMLPDQPKGVSRDVVDLHAWAEVFLPGAGWIGLDATSGLLCGEGHIPLACTATPALASPLSGTASIGASEVSFEMLVGRIGDEPRPTRPFDDTVWERLLEVGDEVDASLVRSGVQLTMGGEPTFNSREAPDAPEWNGDALGPTKLPQGRRLVDELRARLAPGSATVLSSGKHYPGESLPRWALEIIGRKDGREAWPDRKLKTDAVTTDDAQRFASEVATALGVKQPQPAFEDPWRFVQMEESLPVDVDPLATKLTDSEDRRRLARVLERGLAEPVGFVLPIARVDGRFIGARWSFRRERLFLLQGDSPIGLRLPLGSIAARPRAIPVREEEGFTRDPRRPEKDDEEAPETEASIRTALCIEARDGVLYAFVPPFAEADDFFELLGVLDDVRTRLDIDIQIEGYAPSSRETYKVVVTPDPGVLEVNLPVTSTVREHAALVQQVADAALHAGLHSEKYLLDGRMAGSGGGNHLTLGGPTPTTSPFVQHPQLLASLITFIQHHPSLSYLFTGLFVGPTSQAPRVDEARHDALYELEIALAKAFDPGEDVQPWLSDTLFRHLLVDVSGNTHRAEICIDKLFDWRTPHGRQGVVELRAFEMPPHHRMVTAQMLLVRALVACFVKEPYDAPLVRYGQALHDRYLLPYWLWRDFEDVLAYIHANGFELPAEAYQAFSTLRCPLVGRLQADEVTLEVRNAIEPWHVLGEEPSGSGTSRYVDSSMERIELRARNLVAGRHRIVVNGQMVPMQPTHVAGEQVAGVRFRAWAPPHSLHPHLGVHHPLRIEIVDTWAKRSLGACGYHVWHPENRAFEKIPLTRFEASARRAQRFTTLAPSPYPVGLKDVRPHHDAPYTLDLRRLAIDHPVRKPFKRGDA